MYCKKLTKTCIALTLSLNFALNTAFAANYGGNNIDKYSSSHDGYIGVYEPNFATASGGNVYIDSNVGALSANRDAIGGYSNIGLVTNNKITMTGGTIYGYVFGGQSNYGIVANNSVIITGGRVTMDVFGGFSINADATYNIVNVANATINLDVLGAFSSSGATTNNIIYITNSTIDRNVYGGYSNSNSTSNNIISIANSIIKGSIYGGYSFTGNTSTNNNITICGNPFLSLDTTIYGGYSGGAADKYTGNTLNFFATGSTIKNISSFQHYNFIIPSNGFIGLTLIDPSTNFGGSASTIQAPYIASGNKLNVGDTAVVLQANNLSNLPTLGSGKAKQGAAFIYDYTLSQDNNKIIATINSVSINTDNKAIIENNIGNIGLITSGADMVANAGITNAVNTTLNCTDYLPFATTNIANMRYNSGSHVSVNGITLLTGVAKRCDNLTIGYFIEGGWSSYDTFNANNNNGSGHANYYGIGALFKKQFKNNYYIDTSLRLGQIQSGYIDINLTDVMGNFASYHDKSFYYSAHLGIGRIYKLKDDKELDVFTRYLFSHQNGNNVNILGDIFSFKGINSNRLQLGTRYTLNKKDKTNYYLALTYEYEMSGTARTNLYGFDIPSPSIKGSTGIIELGMQINTNKKLAIDLGIQGFIGKRQGFSGSIKMDFKI